MQCVLLHLLSTLSMIPFWGDTFSSQGLVHFHTLHPFDQNLDFCGFCLIQMSGNLAVSMRCLTDMCFSKYSSKSVHNVNQCDSASHSRARWSASEGIPTCLLTDAIRHAGLFVNPRGITAAAISWSYHCTSKGHHRSLHDGVWLIVAILSLGYDIHGHRFAFDGGEPLLKVGVGNLRELAWVIRHFWKVAFFFLLSHNLWDHNQCDAYLRQPSSVLSAVEEYDL